MKKAFLFFMLMGVILSSCASLTESQSPKIPIIVDDDGSMDGVVAMLFFLAHPDYEVIALTSSYGIGRPAIFAKNLGQLLAQVNRRGVSVAAGSELPLAGSNAFPEDWRDYSDRFFGFPLPGKGEPVSALSAPELMVELINASPEPVAVFVSGAHTSLAQALRMDAGIKNNIRWVGVMGGALFVKGNIAIDAASLGYTNETAEWNIWVDPLAAREVFASGLPIYLTALDATDQVTWGSDFSRRWEDSDNPAARVAGKMVTRMNGSGASAYVWDLTAALFAAHPDLCKTETFRVEVVIDPGPDEGRTLALQDPNGSVTACLDPDIPAFHARAEEVFE
jgi:purine nucleosidase/pyrimidine-specific ribonucleoside hydrolase